MHTDLPRVVLIPVPTLTSEGARLNPGELLLVQKLNVALQSESVHGLTVPKPTPEYKSLFGSQAEPRSLSHFSIIVIISPLEVMREPLDHATLTRNKEALKPAYQAWRNRESGTQRAIDKELPILINPICAN